MPLPEQLVRKFTFEPELAIPQIPFVQDVLYILRLTGQPHCFQVAMRDSPTYIANLGLVLVEGASEIRKVRSSGEESIETALTKLILTMCPIEACCLFVPAYVEAAVRSGILTIDLAGMSSREINKACRCNRCNEPLREL